MAELDPRIVTIGIEINGQIKTYEGLYFTAIGTKYGNGNQNECEIKITNLNKETRDFILTETSPFNLNRTPKRVIVSAGRKSYGASVIFVGDIASAQPSQPPDITITLKCLTLNFQKGNMISRSQPGTVALSQVAGQVANDLGIGLNFQATNKMLTNYNFSGAALKQVDKLGELGNIDAFVDDNTLILKDSQVPLTNRLRVLNIDNGMVGIPEITELGVKVTFFLDNFTVLGGSLRIESRINPAVTGDYIIYKLSFNIASRDTPFYWIAETVRQRVFT